MGANILVVESCGHLHHMWVESFVGLGCSEFFVTKVGKLVHSKPELVAPGGVELLDELDIGLEHLEPVCLLSVILLDHPLLVPRHHGRVIIGQFPSCKENIVYGGTLILIIRLHQRLHGTS